MPNWFYAILCLLFESFTVRRDARVRFLMAQVTILRRKLGGNRVVLGPADRAELLRIGSEIGHEVNHVLGIVTLQTYRRWLRQRDQGRQVRCDARPCPRFAGCWCWSGSALRPQATMMLAHRRPCGGDRKL
jgi:putative transposase